jgi:hypothetical protein
MLHSRVVPTNYGNSVLLILQQIQSIVFPLAERWDVAREHKGVYCPSFSRQHIDELIFTFTQYSHLCSATRNAAVTCNIYVICPLLVTTVRIAKRQMLLLQLALLIMCQKIVSNTR